MGLLTNLNEGILGLMSLFGGTTNPRRPGEPDIPDQRNNWNAVFDAANAQNTVTGTSVYPRLPRETLLTLLEDMDSQGLAGAVIDMHTADTCAHDVETGEIFTFEGDAACRAEVKKLFNVLEVDDRITGWVRGMLLYGSEFVRLLYAEDQGVIGTIQCNVRDVGIKQNLQNKKIDGYTEKGHKFRVTDANGTGSDMSYPWDYMHFCALYGMNHRYTPYGKPLLADAVRSWMQVTMAEDAALLGRIQRTDRMGFFIDVGDAPVATAHDIVQEVKGKFRRKQLLDPTLGRLRHEYNTLSSTDDVFLGTRPDSATRVEQWQGGTMPSMDDVNYYLSRFANNAKTPLAALGIADPNAAEPWKANRSAVSQNIAYARTVMSHQRDAQIALFRLAEIHLRLKEPNVESMKYRPHGDENGKGGFRIKMQPPSMIEQLERVEAEVMQMNLAAEAIGITNVANGTVDAYENTLWVFKHILHMPDEYIKKIVTKPPVEPMEAQGPGSRGGNLKPAPLEPRKGVKKRVPQKDARGPKSKAKNLKEFFENEGVPDLSDERILRLVSNMKRVPKVAEAMNRLIELREIRESNDDVAEGQGETDED